MRILKTFGESGNEAREVVAQLESRGATNTAKVDAVVRSIVDDVRQRRSGMGELVRHDAHLPVRQAAPHRALVEPYKVI